MVVAPKQGQGVRAPKTSTLKDEIAEHRRMEALADPAILTAPKLRKANRGGTEITRIDRDDRITPLYILEAERLAGLGRIVTLVDPFSSPDSHVREVWPQARYIVHDPTLPGMEDPRSVQGDGRLWLKDGARAPGWFDDITDAWINPPWSSTPISETVRDVMGAPMRSVLLCPAATCEPWFREVWAGADWVCFLYGRPAFARGGSPEPRAGLPQPICLAGVNWEGAEQDIRKLAAAMGSIGKLVTL
jgi:hypothetical protein